MSPPRPTRILPLVEGAPDALLAEGLALLDEFAQDPRPVLRPYRADRTAIVLGRGQVRELAATSTSSVEVLTRASGGGAVLMDPHLVSLDVLVPAGHPFLGASGDLGAVFLAVGECWAEGLARLGLPGAAVFRGASQARRRGSPREQLLAAVCYATLGRGEVTTGGRKLVGLAQRRRRPGALVQCGLLRRWRPSPLLAALGGDPDDAEVHEAAIGLDETPAGKVSDEEVVARVTDVLRARLDGSRGDGR